MKPDGTITWPTCELYGSRMNSWSVRACMNCVVAQQQNGVVAGRIDETGRVVDATRPASNRTVEEFS